MGHLRTNPGDCRMYETYEGARVGSVVGFRVSKPVDPSPFSHSRTIRGGGWSTRYAMDHLKAIPRDCGTPQRGILAVGVRVFRPVLTPTGDPYP